ncbi:DUP/COS family protein SKDI_01G0870 [Saccharomyces kudriavzevii IFO 1802]|uniref:YAR028W-like protein n=1 Tax=Saccharomyces kudriavzevii (strain ATCC MYA-4449 / AS 2.2408 / CBS 8840 / NBRC 1802 / NCYC 2889) TaxID=226230 RepID=A0AA35JAC0_SACK1|nr:uncharacterized protein SKDI_01G0870 [Saccharomyces kudriavzevii IFO 1802]CAI4054667.1 hypothetical protein SKDI_01G0870 [Saccharomyces kudriavzevii IFO 1802]
MQSPPEDVFNSYWSYLLYEMAHYKPILSLLVVIVSLVLLILFFHDNEVCVVASIVSLIFCIFILPFISDAFTQPISDKDFKIKLSAEVIALRPAGKGWGTTAYNMNQYLFDEGLWNTPYYFYRGRECHDFFRTITKDVPKDTERTLKWYMLKAAEVEEEAQLEYWRKQYPDANLP